MWFYKTSSLLALLASMFWASACPAMTSVGKVIDDFRLSDYRGKEWSLSDYADRDYVVVAFLGTECPLAKLYAGRLQAIAEKYAERGVALMCVMSNSQDSLAEISAFAKEHALSYPVLKDRDNEVADRFGAERTPQVFLLDRTRTIRYRGRIDDQYLVGVIRDQPKRQDLTLAIDALLAGRDVDVVETEAVGCLIGRAREANGDESITYTRDIAPLLQARCVECHREGEIGPFALSTYDDAAGWGEMIVEVVRDRRMPPWHADPKHGKFANDRSMPQEEKERIYRWVKNGCPLGNPAELSEPRKFTPGWQLPREPDVVLAMERPFEVPAQAGRGGVPYQYFRVPTGFTEEKWISAAEVQPGNRGVVHHTIVYAEPPGGRGRRDWVFLSAYVPGYRCEPLPAGGAKRIAAGSTLVFEMHYTPNGSRQEDATRIGLLFAKADQVRHEVATCEIGNIEFEIPPGSDNHVVTATSRPLRREVELLSLSPHMHLRGKSFRYDLVLPSGTRETLLDVPAYDFNWQTRYVLASPRRLPVGSVIHCRAAYNNSDSNLANPDSTKKVRWGDQSWEEMMLGFFDVLIPREDGRKQSKKLVETGLDFVGLFDIADADGDAGLDETEAAAHKILLQHFAAIDRNRDGLLQLGEILVAIQSMGGRD